MVLRNFFRSALNGFCPFPHKSVVSSALFIEIVFDKSFSGQERFLIPDVEPDSAGPVEAEKAIPRWRKR
jgi:hypothetical protein